MLKLAWLQLSVENVSIVLLKYINIDTIQLSDIVVISHDAKYHIYPQLSVFYKHIVGSGHEVFNVFHDWNK